MYVANSCSLCDAFTSEVYNNEGLTGGLSYVAD